MNSQTFLLLIYASSATEFSIKEIDLRSIIYTCIEITFYEA